MVYQLVKNLGSGSVNEALATLAQGPEFKSIAHTFKNESLGWWLLPVNLAWEIYSAQFLKLTH